MYLCILNRPKWPSILSNEHDCIQPTQIKFSSTQMAYIPSNVHSCTLNPKIMKFSNSADFIPSNVHNCTSQSWIGSFSIQMHSTNLNHHSFASNIHLGIIKTLKWTLKRPMCTSTPPMLQSPNLKPPITNRCQTDNQISNLKICVSGPITYRHAIEIDIRSHKQIHIHKDIWIMFGVRWSHLPLVSPFIALLLSWLNNAYGISQLPLPTNHMNLTLLILKPLSNTIL